MQIIKQLIIISSTIFLSTTAFAFDRDHSGHHGQKYHAQKIEKRLEKMSEKLDLTTDQQSQVRAIIESKQAQRKALHEEIKVLRDAGKDRKEIKQLIKPKKEALRTDSRDKIRAVLTAEQREKFDQMHEKRKEHRKEKYNNKKDKESNK